MCGTCPPWKRRRVVAAADLRCSQDGTSRLAGGRKRGRTDAACHDRVRKGGIVEYLIVAEAYRDLEQASGRLVLIERMAELVTQTPAELLPTVCYLCQGQIAPEFAGIDLGLAEKMAIRASAPMAAASARMAIFS